MEHKLGSLESSEALIQDLYIDLKQKINKWAAITHQTAQARMGYVGQHLVSIVTGYPGGKSGARGKDLIISDDEYGEIKTCYRVDQLGKCNQCGSAVASIETQCSSCNSKDIERKEDSKWLISIRNKDELALILEPKYYYFVLFDFTDLNNPHTIRASIWEVESICPGFAYAMIDYYFNIRKNAPLNIWPFQLKFDLMRGKLIYISLIIHQENRIETQIFPGRDKSQIHYPQNISIYSRSRNLTFKKLQLFATQLKLNCSNYQNKTQLIKAIDNLIEHQGGFDNQIIDMLAKCLYWDNIEKYISELPSTLSSTLTRYNLA
ncbi:MAG: MamI family restriction endonuclease [Xenococcaceae cyanobacterium MO_167.B27]|nr:MamI family restriction endonuclease [Xenococcaceae cyanobacterium MO_167.B27]